MILDAGGKFRVERTAAEMAVDTLALEIDDVDTAVNLRKGMTEGVDSVLKIKEAMSELEGGIAYHLGCKKKAGISEILS